jgi:hypothetical protein
MAGAVCVVLAFFVLLFTTGKSCPAILVTWPVRFTVVDESTGRRICDASIRAAVQTAVPAEECQYEIELDNLNNPPTVVISRSGYASKTIELPMDECLPIFEAFPSRIALSRDE